MYLERAFKDLLALCLKKWKTLIVGALLGAMLFGAYQYNAQMKIKNDPTMSEEAIEERYQIAMGAYNAQVSSLRAENDKDSRTVSSVQKYLEESLLMKIDPYNKYTKTMDVTFDFLSDDRFATLYEYNTTPYDYMINLIRKRYLASVEDINLSSIGVFNELHPGLDNKYWDEVVSIRSREGGLIEINAVGTSEEEVTKLCEALYDFLSTKTPVISETSFEHELVVISDVSRVEIDTALESSQYNQIKSIEDANSRIAIRNGEIGEIEVPQKEAGFSVSSMKRATVKFSLIGTIAGCILAMFVVMLHCIAVKQVITAKEITDACGITYVGAISKKDRHIPFLSELISGERRWKNQESAAAYIAERIGNLNCGNRVLISSTLALNEENETVNLLQKALKDKYEVGVAFNALYNVDFVKKMENSDVIVLLEKSIDSRLEIIEEVKKLCEQNNKLVCYVMVLK